MLKLNNVKKAFGGLVAVNDVNLSVEEGSIVGLIGPNGSGKTTLFNVISGVLPLTTGTVEFNGVDISSKKSHEVSQLGLVRTFQKVKPFNNISVLDNVIAGSFLKNHTRGHAREKAEEVMEMVGITQYKDELPKNLPLAIKKKIEIARILATNPKMLLLDEVMGGLNSQETDELSETVKKINKMGITILIIEHKMKCIMSLSERVVVLNNGTKIADGIPSEVVSNEEVIRAYLGDDYNA
ncbi:ABC transporter ATP-binding protein [Clostridium sediminicola]|uniref:ABC transporter ATP-binding protein n=1 Tax=Clostridium sediminicola TaxID=3114879 RepID=UPI0031F1E908